MGESCKDQPQLILRQNRLILLPEIERCRDLVRRVFQQKVLFNSFAEDRLQIRAGPGAPDLWSSTWQDDYVRLQHELVDRVHGHLFKLLDQFYLNLSLLHLCRPRLPVRFTQREIAVANEPAKRD